MARQGKGKWIRRNETQWRSLLSRFSESGLSVSAFCRREGVSTASLYRWRGLVERHDGGEALPVARQPAFVDLGTLRGESARGAPVELRLDLGGGLTLHLVRR
jgi:transposase-like protein